MKKHSLEESEDLDEPTTDSMLFEAQVSTKKKGSNVDYKYNKTLVEDFHWAEFIIVYSYTYM